MDPFFHCGSHFAQRDVLVIDFSHFHAGSQHLSVQSVNAEKAQQGLPSISQNVYIIILRYHTLEFNEKPLKFSQYQCRFRSFQFSVSLDTLLPQYHSEVSLVKSTISINILPFQK